MKKSLKLFFVSLTLFIAMATSISSYAQQSTVGEADPCAGGCLPPATISCVQHTVDLQIGMGVISVTYKILVTVCDNGEEYYDLIR